MPPASAPPAAGEHFDPARGEPGPLYRQDFATVDGPYLPSMLPKNPLATGVSFQDAPPTLDGEAPAGGATQPGTTGAPGSQPGGGQGGPGFDPFLILMLGMGVFLVMMIFTSGRRQKREQRERQGMLEALKRNDKVQTIGGIIGTVAEVRNDEVVLKVDDAGHNKIRFARSAIQQVISSRGGPAEATPTEEPEPTN